MEKMGVKKSMFMIWAVASVLWATFCIYMFNLQRTGYVYHRYDHFAERVARGRSADPFQWDYNKRGYKRAQQEAEKLHKDMGLFILFGFGFPGLMLSVGTFALRNIDKPKKRKKP